MSRKPKPAKSLREQIAELEAALAVAERKRFKVDGELHFIGKRLDDLKKLQGRQPTLPVHVCECGMPIDHDGRCSP